MKNLLALLGSFCLLFIACDSECNGCESLLFEANVVVVDISGKPIVGKKVFVTGRATANLVTDKNGRIKFNDVWSTSNFGSSWKLFLEESDSLRSINYLEPTNFNNENEKFTINDTIKVDSLKLITVRLRSSKTTLTNLYLSAFVDKSGVYNAIIQPTKRDFIRFNNKIPKSQLDTTIQFKAYSKMGFTIQGGVGFNAVDNSGKTIFVKDFEKRDSFLIEL